jgi:hypothetical protein
MVCPCRGLLSDDAPIDTRPPLTASTEPVAVAGLGERGRESGTDAFDYALSQTTAHLAVFEAGPGTPKRALVTAAVLAAYRRRDVRVCR